MCTQTVSDQSSGFQIQISIANHEVNSLSNVATDNLYATAGRNVIDCVGTTTPVNDDQIDVVSGIDEVCCKVDMNSDDEEMIQHE